MKYISLGGWCGTAIALKYNNLREEALPFDNIRSTFIGVIDCIKNDFINYFPKKIKNEGTLKHSIFRSKYFGFYYHNNLNDKNIIEMLQRRILRFNKILKETTDNIIFVRTIVSDSYIYELNLSDIFIREIIKINENLNFVLILIIPEQEITEYYMNINKKVFLFTLNDKTHDNNHLGEQYKPIFEFTQNNNLFLNIPEIKIKKINDVSRLSMVNNILPFDIEN